MLQEGGGIARVPPCEAVIAAHFTFGFLWLPVLWCPLQCTVTTFLGAHISSRSCKVSSLDFIYFHPARRSSLTVFGVSIDVGHFVLLPAKEPL